MITTLLMSLMLPLGVAEGEATFPGLSLQPGGMFRDPPVQVWLSKRDRLRRGDRVRAYAQTDEDGYLLVLHAEPDGRIRVLFPLDPVDDHFVRAGETYEIRGRGDRDAFQVMESSGSGAVFAAFSRDPFRFDQLVRSDHWDYMLDTWVIGDDAEGDLVRLADYMAAGATYEYDLIRYEVNRYIVHGRYGSQLGLYVGSHYGRTWFGVSWGDPYYYSSWYYRPYYYRPYRYVYYDPFYDPYYTPFFPVWYDACWYGPCYYRAHYYAYYSYGPRYYRGYYDSRWYNRDYYWRSGAGRYDGGRYAFKDGLAPRGIEPRSRAPLATAVTRRLLSPEDTRAGSIGRRTLGVNSTPQAATNGGRRLLTTPAQATPTRAAPAPTTTRRATEPVRRDPVIVGKPIRITNPPPQRGQPQADPDRREVQDPRRVTPDTPVRAPQRQAEPRGEVKPREQGNRTIVPVREPQQRSPRETTRPRLERRQPQSRPRAEPRSSPPPRAEPRSAPSRRAEPRSAPPRRAEPRSSAPSRAAPRSAPPPRAAARSSAPPRAAAPARGSTPARAAPAPRGGRRSPPRRPG